MDVPLAVLADYANISQDGKLNILGVFGEINPPVLPFALPTMYLVVVYSASPAEVDSDKTIRVILIDGDGREVLRMEQSLKVPPPNRPGTRTEVSAVLGLNGVRFEHAGDYQFSILVGGEIITGDHEDFDDDAIKGSWRVRFIR